MEGGTLGRWGTTFPTHIRGLQLERSSTSRKHVHLAALQTRLLFPCNLKREQTLGEMGW